MCKQYFLKCNLRDLFFEMQVKLRYEERFYCRHIGLRMVVGQVNFQPIVGLLLHSMIGYWYHPVVSPSVCLSVCNAMHCGSQGPG